MDVHFLCVFDVGKVEGVRPRGCVLVSWCHANATNFLCGAKNFRDGDGGRVGDSGCGGGFEKRVRIDGTRKEETACCVLCTVTDRQWSKSCCGTCTSGDCALCVRGTAVVGTRRMAFHFVPLRV